MSYFWDERFKSDEYIYGVKPNSFFEESIKRLKIKGEILFPAEGEGRNAVYAAKQGLNTTAFDLSIEGKNKALKLARKNNVSINYLVGDLENIGLKDNSFDAIVLIFAHFNPSIRANFHSIFSKLLKKGGVLILEGFSKNNLDMDNNNGPKSLDLLFTKNIISNDFSGLNTISISEEIVDIDEGNYHVGKSSVIRYIGVK